MPAMLVAHHRPGFYFRVLRDGAVQAGDEIVQVASGPEAMTVAEVDALLYLPGHPRQQLQRALRIPALPDGWKKSFQAMLGQPAAAGTAGWQRRAGRRQSAACLAGIPPAVRHCDRPGKQLGDLGAPGRSQRD